MSQMITVEQFQKRLKKATSQAPEKHERLLTSSGKRLLDNAAQETPEDEGRLNASYKRQTWDGQKEWVLEVEGDKVKAGTNVYYARMVEEGHPIVRIYRVRRGKRVRRKKEILGFVSGKHYFRKAFEKTEKELPDLADDFFRELGKEMGLNVKG